MATTGKRARRSPAQAKAEFLAILERKGARLADGAVYRNTATAVGVVCGAGHRGDPRPGNVLQGQGLCRVCGGNDPAVAAAAFRVRVAALGGALADGAAYVNSETPVRLICAFGHPCAPRPNSVLKGQGLCRICSGRDAATAAAAFRARVAALGGVLADGATYVNTTTRVPVVCAAGHRCDPRPLEVMRGGWLCRICSRRDAPAAEESFLDRVAGLGGTLVAGARYVDALTPVPLVCAAGHRCAPRPNSLQQGQGLCDRCVAEFDRVYLLVHPHAGAIKVGVTGGPGRVRRHTGRGYRLVAQWTGLGHHAARAAERAVISSWRNAGVGPAAAAPRDGRTETAPAVHLADTRAQLEELLGPATEAHDVPALADALLAAAATAA